MNAETSKTKVNYFPMMSPPSAETATKWITAKERSSLLSTTLNRGSET